MTLETPDLQAIAERLERLEKQNRRFKHAAILLLVVASAILLMGQAAPKQTVEANRFLLRDSYGKIRAELGFLQGQVPSLRVFDATGEEGAALGVGEHGFVTLSNAKRGSVVSMTAEAGILLFGRATESGINLVDAAKQTRATLVVDNNVPVLNLNDRSGRPRASVEVQDAGPVLIFRDANKTTRVGLSAGKSGAAISFHDSNGKPRLFLSTSAQKGPAIETFDAGGRVTLIKP